MFLTFWLTVLAWIFFRADSVSHAFEYLKIIFSKTLFNFPVFENRTHAFETLILIGFLVIIEWKGRSNQFGIEKFALSWNRSLRIGFYLLIICLIFLFLGQEQEFIYFQF